MCLGSAGRRALLVVGLMAAPVAGRRTAEQRRRWVQTLEWTDEQVAVLRRAERLRYFSAHKQACDLVARECQLPMGLTVNDVPHAARLDVARWHRALVGVPWDGSTEAFRRARDRSNAHRNQPVPEQPVEPHGVRAFRACHLLVEPLDGHPCVDELRDYTRLIGWPSVSYVGRLDWNGLDGPECAFCAALLLPSECQPIPGALGVVCGQHCCARG